MFLTPGTVALGHGQPVASEPINISVNGQRPDSNSFYVDSVSGNFGIAPGGQSPGASAGGSTPALTATGGTNALSSLAAAQEVTIRSYYNNPEYGRSPGAQISIVSRAGTNEFHGSGFYFFGHDAMDANDWFANSRGFSKPRRQSNNFGGTLGGPLRRDHFFFFGAYEGLRLRQPVFAITDVPSLAARRLATGDAQKLLNLYPLPTGPARADGFAEFAAGFANAGQHDNASLRVDGNINNRLSVSTRYSFMNSSADERGAGGFSLNTLNSIFSRAQTLTASATQVLSPTLVVEGRVNYSRLNVRSALAIDGFGGATLSSSVITQSGSFSADLNGRSTIMMSGSEAISTQRQLNAIGALSLVSGNHSLKFGADYRRMSPIIGLRAREQSFLFDGVTQALAGQAARASLLTRSGPQQPLFHNLSVYGQDELRWTPNLTLTFGLRWEISPAPIAADGRNALAVDQISDPARMNLNVPSARLWNTTYGNLAPRLGVAYQTSDGALTIRGGFGVHYDVSNAAAGDVFADSYPYLNGGSLFKVPFSFSAPQVTSSATIQLPFSAFDPHLRLPYSLAWNASIEHTVGRSQILSAAYVGASGRRLLLTQTLFNPNSSFDFVRLTNNGASSNYHSLQLQLNRRLSQKLGALVSYTWSKSIDNFSQDTAARVLFRSDNERFERGPSDFDVRHTLSGFVTYQLPKFSVAGLGDALLRDWMLDSVFSLRSANPINVIYAIPTSYGYVHLRPDLLAGVPLYLADSNFAGETRINPAAFAAPQDFRQGTLGRNSLRGFGLTQVNFALRRQFTLKGPVTLTAGIEARNVFNHPNFGTPIVNDARLGTRFDLGAPLHQNPTFGQSLSTSSRSPWGGSGSSFGSLYYPGGARTLQFTLKLSF